MAKVYVYSDQPFTQVKKFYSATNMNLNLKSDLIQWINDS